MTILCSRADASHKFRIRSRTGECKTCLVAFPEISRPPTCNTSCTRRSLCHWPPQRYCRIQVVPFVFPKTKAFRHRPLTTGRVFIGSQKYPAIGAPLGRCYMYDRRCGNTEVRPRISFRSLGGAVCRLYLELHNRRGVRRRLEENSAVPTQVLRIFRRTSSITTKRPEPTRVKGQK